MGLQEAGCQAAEGMTGLRAHSLTVSHRRIWGKGILGRALERGRNPEKGSMNMQSLLGSAVRFLRAEDGPTAVEYAVMLALIIVVCIAAITTLGNNAKSTFSNVALNGTLTTSS
jgi:pilus assembly protein Flp/PilA